MRAAWFSLRASGSVRPGEVDRTPGSRSARRKINARVADVLCRSLVLLWGATIMKIALIAAHAHPIALGLRYVSSYLKSAGHEVAMFLMSSRRDTARADYTPATLADQTTG